MLNFIQKEPSINIGDAQLTFYRKGFTLNEVGSSPSYIDVILSGVSPLVLANAIAGGLNYLKLFGGTEQRNLPSGFTQVEYLQSDGSQYINTGVVLKSEATITTVGQFLSTSSSAPISIWGFMGDGTYPRWGCSVFLGQWLMDLNFTSSQIYADTNKHTLVNKTDGSTWYECLVDGVSLYGRPSLSNQETYTSNVLSAYIFARNNSNTAGNFSSSRIYSFNIVQDDIEVINLIPARRNSDNVLGMYDTVSGNFLTNQGTGTFTAGADVVPTPDTPMDIVCNNGVVKVNTNLYWTEYNGYELSQVDGITLRANSGVNVSGMVDCRTIKSFKITTASPQGSFRIFKYRADNTYIDANSTASIGDIITLEDNVGFFRIQYNFTNSGTGTENILIYNSAYDLNGIYTDGTVETVNVHGRNLFNQALFNTYVDNSITYTTFEIPNGTYIMSTNFPVVSRVTNVFVFAGEVTSGASTDNNGVYNGQNRTITVLDGKYTVAYRSQYSMNANDPKDYDFQLEQGSTATAYEPYFNVGQATAEMLLKVGDYKDVQEVLAGNVTRNIGIKVLDGTEDWQLINTPYFSLAKSNITPSTLSGDNFNSICSHFVRAESGTELPTKVCFFWGKSYLNINIDVSGSTTVAQFKQYLADQYNAGTPVIIVYPLATATTESVTGQPLTVQAGTNIVEITQASIDDLTMEASFKQQA